MSLSFQFLKTVAQREGSTRPLALIRIGIVLLLWNKFGKDIGVFAAENASYLMISLLFFLFSTLTLIGFRTRAAAAGLFFTVFLIYHFYGFVLDHWEWTHHHVYMLMFGCFVLMISPCGRSYSVDRYLRIRRAAQKGENPPAERGALWAQSLIPLQMSALYFWAAYDKTIPAYFKGEWLERVLEWGYAGHPFYEVITLPALIIAASLMVLVIEYYLAVAVLYRLWPKITYPLGIGLHLCFALLLNVDTYSLTMILFYLALLNPDRVHIFIDELQGQGPVRRPA